MRAVRAPLPSYSLLIFTHRHTRLHTYCTCTNEPIEHLNKYVHKRRKTFYLYIMSLILLPAGRWHGRLPNPLTRFFPPRLHPTYRIAQHQNKKLQPELRDYKQLCPISNLPIAARITTPAFRGSVRRCWWRHGRRPAVACRRLSLPSRGNISPSQRRVGEGHAQLCKKETFAYTYMYVLHVK